MDLITTLLQSGLAQAAPIILVALGEVISERSGVLNLGLEGMMLTGAFAGTAASGLSGNPWLGLAAGICFLFGIMEALGERLQGMFPSLPSRVSLMAPFLLALAVMALFPARRHPPQALGKID